MIFLKIPGFTFLLSGILIGQLKDPQVKYEEKSFNWKKGKDILILDEGDLFYGKYLKRDGDSIIFLREYQSKADVYFIADIKLLELSNGKKIVRDNRAIRSVCFLLGPIIALFVSFPIG